VDVGVCGVGGVLVGGHDIRDAMVTQNRFLRLNLK